MVIISEQYFLLHLFFFNKFMHELSLQRIRNWEIISRKYLHYTRNFRPSHYFFPRLCQDYNQKQYYTFNTLIICSSASLYRRAPRNPELRGKFIPMDLLPREAFYERLVLLELEFYDAFLRPLFLSLSVKISVRSLNSALIHKVRGF